MPLIIVGSGKGDLCKCSQTNYGHGPCRGNIHKGCLLVKWLIDDHLGTGVSDSLREEDLLLQNTPSLGTLSESHVSEDPSG